MGIFMETNLASECSQLSRHIIRRTQNGRLRHGEAGRRELLPWHLPQVELAQGCATGIARGLGDIWRPPDRGVTSEQFGPSRPWLALEWRDLVPQLVAEQQGGS